MFEESEQHPQDKSGPAKDQPCPQAGCEQEAATDAQGPDKGGEPHECL